MGRAARVRVIERFSMASMSAAYRGLLPAEARP
jgi:hypothetical protein